MKKSKPLSQVLEHLHYGPAAIGWPEHIAWAWHQRLVRITGALKDEQPKFNKEMKDHAEKIKQKGEKAHGNSNWVNPLGFSWVSINLDVGLPTQTIPFPLERQCQTHAPI